MKKILIVNSNCKIGGIQKAMVDMLKKLHNHYDITLLLLYKAGPLLEEIPADVKVIETKSDFKYIGRAQSDCRSPFEKLMRAGYGFITKKIGKKYAVQLMKTTLKRDALEAFDLAISYFHMESYGNFYGGVADYVCGLKNAKKKICYIHCDYADSGARSPYSDRLYAMYDGIICVSESTKARFVQALPQLKDCTYAMYNAIDQEAILAKAKNGSMEYDKDYINVVSVARLSPEKGISRLINVIGQLKNKKIRYYVVGGGRERAALEQMIAEQHLEDQIFLLGEDANPYRYMLHADLLAVPSFNEAAPVVFQEAIALGLPVLTTRTMSADEMIGDTYGFVVDNSEEALLEKLREILNNPDVLKHKKAEKKDEEKSFADAFADIISKVE